MPLENKKLTREERKKEKGRFKRWLYITMFEAKTPAGRRFDLYLMGVILFSLLILMIESLPSLSPTSRYFFYIIEWVLSIIFVIEYILRIYVSAKPFKYIASAWGVIDLLSILPVLFLAFFESTHYFRIIRILRLIRVFKVFRVNKFTKEAYSLYHSLVASIYKISVFMFFVILLAVISGGIMFVVEGNGENDFNSVPESIYWAIVTVTTVGFGDMAPTTDLGKFIASIMMLLGYAIIAVPTGIVSLEMFRHQEKERAEESTSCQNCSGLNRKDATYCNQCGSKLKNN